MARKARSNYIEAALSILTELGGGPLSSKDLVKIAQERGLVGTTTYVYHNFLRKVRDSNLFDTSVRGQISLIPVGAHDVVGETAEPMSAPLAGAPAAVISEILSNDLPETETMNTVEDEETDPDEVRVNREF
ncbi:hypothetical protein LCGC14_1865690 [marine sediment metagenome]|uniref:Uncharacterized protein n=1 Tax=marine sediment metagenome TaxID=412755 RepID=A0A0F9GUJ2_9ZZZZ